MGNPPSVMGRAYFLTRQFDEARAIVARLRIITPVVMPSVVPYQNTEDRELFLSGLRVAAGEEA